MPEPDGPRVSQEGMVSTESPYLNDLADPYGNCERYGCHHDLARTVLTTDIMGEEDGPFKIGTAGLRMREDILRIVDEEEEALGEEE